MPAFNRSHTVRPSWRAIILSFVPTAKLWEPRIGQAYKSPPSVEPPSDGLSLCGTTGDDVKTGEYPGRCDNGQNCQSEDHFRVVHISRLGHLILGPAFNRLRPRLRITAGRQLFDYFVGKCQQGGRYGDAERFCGLEIDNQSELACLLDGEVAGLRAVQNFSGIYA